VPSAFADSVTGGQILVTSTGNVTASFVSSDTDDTDAVSLVQPAPKPVFLCDGSAVPAVIGSFAAGVELVFGLEDLDVQGVFFTGPADRNSDQRPHALMTDLTGFGSIRTLRVAWEDRAGDDYDYNDCVIDVTGPLRITSTPTCNNGFDDDGDGLTDFPTDPDCQSQADEEANGDVPPPSCPPVQPGIIVCIASGAEVARYTVQRVDADQTGPMHHIAGYLDAYRFTIGGVTVTLPCVGLTTDNTTVNPCAAAGGTFVSRTSTLVDQTVSEPTISSGDEVASVGVCAATLTITAFGFGIDAAPAYGVC
jgi:hypothetical protein